MNPPIFTNTQPNNLNILDTPSVPASSYDNQYQYFEDENTISNNTIPDYIGSDFLGQSRLKARLNFYISNQHKNGFLPFTLFQARKGSGKTTAARALARNLINFDKTPRKALEINGSCIGSVREFVDTFLVPYILGGQEVTLFIDEVAECKPSLLSFLLSILQPNRERRSKINYHNVDFEFDFYKFNFICATTNSEKLSEAFKSRFARQVQIEPYTNEDLIKILHRNTQAITFTQDTEHEIVSVCRRSPREVVLLSQNEISSYCEGKNINTFGPAEWVDLATMLDIKPLGLNNQEIELLRFLSDGEQTLTAIAAKLGLCTSTIRKDVELFLLSHGLIKIDGKRQITHKGADILKLC